MQRITWLFPVSTLVLCLFLILAGYRNPAVTFPSPGFQKAHRLSSNLPAGSEHATRRAVDHSAPTPLSLDPEAQTGVEMTFSHIGNGEIAGTDRFFQTTLILVNNTRRNTEGSLDFYDDQGTPLVVTIDGTAASRFPFSMQGTAVKRFVTSGQGSVQSGWARIHSQQPLSGTASFGIRDDDDTVYTDVGVAESIPGSEFTLFADTIGSTNTGIAAANPSLTSSLSLDMELYDSAGDPVATETADLGAGGHLARFLTEIFAGVAGISEFEGSVVLRSDRDFTGITLRSTGDQLTSMPMVEPAPGDADWTKLVFPHVGDGTAGGLSITTSVVLFNNTGQPASGTLHFIASDGNPMAVSVGGQTAGSFPFSIQPGGVKRIETEGIGTLQAGWAEVDVDQPIGGTALYAITDQSGTLLSEVGVEAAYLHQSFDLIADTLGASNTGIAFANPHPNEAIDIRLELFDQWGYFTRGLTRTLQPRSHEALFLTELFPMEETIDEFDGFLEISAYEQGGNDRAWVAPVCLRQVGTKLTSLPTLQRKYGFAPDSTISLPQTLAGTSPALHWNVTQRSGELMISRAAFVAPGVTLSTDNVVAGEPFACGNTESDTLELVASQLDPFEFDIINANKEGRNVFASGIVKNGSGAGLELELSFRGEQEVYLLGRDVGVSLFFPPGLFQMPASSGSLPLTVTFESVSMDPDRERPILRRLEQSEYLNQPAADGPNLHTIEPLFIREGGFAVLRGTNFGEAPQVRFRTSFSGRTLVEPLSSTDTTLEVIVPENFTDDSIQVVAESGWSSNRYQPWVLFSPVLEFQIQSGGSASGGFTFRFNQSSRTRQLKTSSFELRIFDAASELAGLAAGSVVGNVTFDDSKYKQSFQLKVRSATSEEAVLDLITYAEETEGVLTVSRVEDDWTGLQFDYQPSEDPSGPEFSYWTRWEWVLNDVPLTFSGNEETGTAWAKIYSAPNGYDDPSAALQADQMVFFLTAPE